MKNNERVLATREKLIDGAIASLAEIGYHRTTFLEVARRSDLSRGAIHHHFDSMPDLMATVTKEIAQRLEKGVAEVFAPLPPESNIYSVIIDFVWEQMHDTPYRALDQIRTAAATDSSLSKPLMPVVKLLAERLQEQARRTVSAREGEESVDASVIDLILYALAGTASYDLSLGPPPKDPDRSVYLSNFKQMITDYASKKT